MKIALVIKRMEFPITEGTQRQVWELYNILSKKHDVTIIHFQKTSKQNYYYKDCPEEKFDVIHFFWLDGICTDRGTHRREG